MEVISQSLSKYMSQSLSPLISIIVLNRNGHTHLNTLLPALSEHTNTEMYELIMVDNASTDESVKYLKKNQYELPIILIENDQNFSFSTANNQAAKIAKGKYLLLLNNDVIPSKNWLQKLLKPIQQNTRVASVGAKLVYPQRKEFKYAGLVQHAGITFVYEGDVIRPYNLGNTYDINHPVVITSTVRPALTAACLLVHKRKYFEVGGLDEEYIYGFEDVDLGLKFIQAGYINYYCAEVTLVHCEFGTQSKDKRVEVIKRRQKNLEYFRKQWFHFLKKEYWTEKLYSYPPFFSEFPLVVSLLGNENKGDVQSNELEALKKGFDSRGWKVIDQSNEASRIISIGQEIDMIFSTALDIRFKTSKVRKQQIKILWLNHNSMLTKGSNGIAFAKYDIVLDGGGEDLTLQFPSLHFSFYQNNLSPVDNQSDSDIWIVKIQKQLQRAIADRSIAIILPIKKWQNGAQWQGYKALLYLKETLTQLGYCTRFQVMPRYKMRYKNNTLNESDAIIYDENMKTYIEKIYQINIKCDYSNFFVSHHKEFTLKDEKSLIVRGLRSILGKLIHKKREVIKQYSVNKETIACCARQTSILVKPDVKSLPKT